MNAPSGRFITDTQFLSIMAQAYAEGHNAPARLIRDRAESRGMADLIGIADEVDGIGNPYAGPA